MQDINHPTTNDAGSSPCTPEAHQRSGGLVELFGESISMLSED